jgi:hypothetical protein
MARFNEILVGRYNRFLQKLFGMKGSPPAPQLASEIGATFEIENPPVEDRILLGWNRFGLSTSVTGVAGASVRFRNPTNNNVVAVFESFIVASGASPDQPFLELARFTADYAGLLSGRRLDARMDPANVGASFSLVASSATSRVSLGSVVFRQINLGANISQDFVLHPDQELTLLPGDALQVNSGQNANTLLICAIWRERTLEESERSN